MTNYSRTTLRELKKRYLNVLKKCLLANLGFVLLSVPAMADSVAKKNDGSSNIVINDTQNDGSELLEYLTDETYYVITDGVFSNIIIDESGKVVTYIGEPNIDENGFITYTYKPNGGILNNSGQLTFKGGIVSFERGVSDISGYGVNSGGGAINNSGTITFENSEFINNKVVITGSNSHAFGGAVLNNGEMNFGDVRFYNNQLDGMAESMGGAVYNGSSGEMTFSGNVLFENNQANPSNSQLGGAIANKGTMVFGSNSDVTFFNNSSTLGGAIYNQGNISFDGKVLFEKNTGSSYGVIWNRNASSILSFKTANFIGNQVGQNSSTVGGVVENSGLFSITESALFQGNKAAGQNYGISGGGAIHNTSNGIKDENGLITTYGAYLKNATFLSNVAEHTAVTTQSTMKAGGGAIINTGTMMLDGYTIFGGYQKDDAGNYVLDENENKISLGNIAHGISFEENGVLYSGNSLGGALLNSGTMVIGPVEFISNLSKSDLGQNMGCGGGGAAVYNEYGTITFTGTALFEDNIAWAGYSSEGGAIKNRPNSGIASINFKGKAEFYNNQSLNVNGSYNIGGAIANNSEMVFEKEAIFGKYVLDENGNKTYDSDGNPITLGNKAISEQSDSTAGAVYNSGKGFFDFKGITTFIGNISNGYTSAAGGAVSHYVNLIKFHDDAEFLDNKAIGQTRLAEGGAIFTDYSSSMIFNKKADFKNNSALGYTAASGGAIFNKTGSATIKQNVDEEGNAILDENGNPSLEPVYTYGITFRGDTLFTGNKAESVNGSANGGAIYNSGYMLLAGENTFDSNQAKQGGAIYNTGGKKEGDVSAYGMTLGKSTFMNNTALSNGGAIFNHGSGIISLLSADFINNVANAYQESCGGGLYNNGQVTFNGIVKFEKNQSITKRHYASGGAIRNSSVNAIIDFNEHVLFGGYDSEGNSLGNVATVIGEEDEDGKIVGFHARGGAIYNEQQINFKSAEFINNKALGLLTTSLGGAIHNTGNAANINFSELAIFQDNIAEGYTNIQGGAIYNYLGTITFGGLATFEGNTSSATDGHSWGGAIVNNAGSVVFEDTDNNAETPAVPNITYGMTFNGNTLFTGNKAESETGNSYGGAIFNTGYMVLEGKNTFGGYEVDENGDYALDLDGNKISLGNEAKYGGAIYNSGGKKEGDVIAYGMTLGKSTFMGNTALSTGGAIWNSGYMNFTDEVLFEENKSMGYGGAINNGGCIDFKGSTIFIKNESNNRGGAIYNGGKLNFEKTVLFADNESGMNGGAFENKGIINFNNEEDKIKFIGNTAYDSGGAFVNYGENVAVNFHGDVEFISNTATNTKGGAIWNYAGSINFNKDAKFEGNKAKGDAGAIYNGNGAIITFNGNFNFMGNIAKKGNDIANDSTINFAHGYADDGVTPLIGSLDGGISNAGIINKTGAGTLILGDAMVNSGTGTFNQSAGLTIAHTDHFLTGTNNITGGELRVHGANMNNLKATVGGDALLTFLSTSTSEIEMKLGENVSVAGDVKFGADDSVGTAKYHLKEDVTAKIITIQDSFLTAENKVFNGTYVMGENVILNMQDGDAGDSVSFTNLTGSANLKIDADIVNGENGLELVTDQIETNSDATLKLNLTDVVLSENALDNGLSDSYTATVMIGGTLTYGSEKGLVATDVYSYEVSGANNQITIDAVKFNEDSDVMKSVAEFDGDAAFNMTIGGDSYEMQSDVTMTENTKSIIGKGKETSTLTAKKITVDGAILNVENVSVSGENQLIDVASGTLNVTNAKVDNIKNAGEATLDTAEVSELENSGTLTANSSEIGELMNEHEAEVTSGKVTILTNKGSMTANGSEIGELLNEKDAEVTGGKVTKVTNKGELTVTGVTITELLNEQEATITGGELETATNKEKGMLSLSAGLRAGTVTNEGELTLDGVTVADLTNSATLKANGSTLTKLVNEHEAELTASTVEDLTNMGKMTAKDLTLKGALKGEGTATLSGKLVADDIFKSENKIISDGMEVSENVKKMELADLEIKDGTTLDIGTREVTAKDVTVGKEATLQVTLNNLDEHGTMKADKIEAGAGAGVHLVLGEKFEGGVFDVFKGTKGAGDLEVKHNNLYNVIEVEEGKYSFMTKDTEALQESLGATKEEVSVADAMTKGTASHETFARMQSEVLVALQSLDTQTVEKAKKALTALSGRSTSLYQSQATAGFTQLHNVVSQMLMNTAAPVFGHAGGEEPARASVYIKGLYDRVNSLTGDGFRMRSKGAVLGVQSAVTEDLTVGVGYAGVDTTAKEPLRRTEVKTNTGFISAQYQPNNWWVSGVVSYSRSQYDEEKQVLSSTGKANYDVDSLGAQITTGYNIKKGKIILTPEVGIRYLNARQEGYKDSLGTTVQATNSDFVTMMAGFKVGADLGWVRPLAGVMVGYDVITDDISSVNTLANGATYTINGKALDRLSTTVVAGFGMDIGKNATLKLEYNGNYRKEYLDHSGMLRLEMKF